MAEKRVQLVFFVILVSLVVALLYFIFKPYLGALFFALVFTVVFEPVYRFINRFVGNRRSISAFLTVTFILFVILLPFIFFGYFFFEDARDLYGRLESGQIEQGFVENALASFEKIVTTYIPAAKVNVQEYINQALGSILNNFSGVFSKFFSVIVDVIIMFFALFFFLKDGPHFKEKLFAISPLADSYDSQIWAKIRLAVNSVVRGTLLVASIQGMLTGIGFAIFGVPSPFVWGAVAAVTALIPAVGTSIVLIPGIIYLFFTGGLSGAIGLLLWSFVIVGLIDNFLGPILIKRGIEIHPLLILLSVIGGLNFFGPVGFIAGPVMLSVFLTMLEIFPSVLNTSEKRTQ